MLWLTLFVWHRIYVPAAYHILHFTFSRFVGNSDFCLLMGHFFQVETSSDLLDRKHRQQYRKKMESWKKGKLTSCCWSVCPAQHSCNFRAVYRSEATRPYHSRPRSPQQSSHLTDPEPHRQYCASAGQKHIHKRLMPKKQKLRHLTNMQKIQQHLLNLEFTSLQSYTTPENNYTSDYIQYLHCYCIPC